MAVINKYERNRTNTDKSGGALLCLASYHLCPREYWNLAAVLGGRTKA